MNPLLLFEIFKAPLHLIFGIPVFFHEKFWIYSIPVHRTLCRCFVIVFQKQFPQAFCNHFNCHGMLSPFIFDGYRIAVYGREYQSVIKKFWAIHYKVMEISGLVWDYYAAINLWHRSCFQCFIRLSRHKVYIFIRRVMPF